MKIGIVGCGMIGELRAQAITLARNAELRVVCDADAERARRLAARYHCAAETEWPKMVTRDDVDVIVISTPNDLHAEVALSAMAAGKHVLCEKPLARTPEECRRMVTAAHQFRVKLMTGFNHRRYPPVRKAKELLEGGAIGTPLSMRGWIGHEAGQEFLNRWFANSAISGGGTLVDNGVHLIDLVRFFLGEVTEVQGDARTALWQIHPCEDQALVLLKTAQGPSAFIMASWTEWRGYHFWLQVHGSHGILTFQYPPMLTVVDTKRPNGRRPKRTRFFFLREQAIERIRGYRWTIAQSFSGELEELMAAIQENREASPSGFDGLRAVEIAIGAYKSSQEGRRIPVSPSSS